MQAQGQGAFLGSAAALQGPTLRCRGSRSVQTARAAKDITVRWDCLTYCSSAWALRLTHLLLVQVEIDKPIGLKFKVCTYFARSL